MDCGGRVKPAPDGSHGGDERMGGGGEGGGEGGKGEEEREGRVT